MSHSFLVVEKEHRYYQIQKGDTLQSVAAKLGLDPREMRYYHNMNADLKDGIGKDFPWHLKVLILQTEEDKQKEKAEEEKIRKEIVLNTSFNLAFLPDQGKKEYKIKYTIDNGETIDTLQQEMSVQHLLIDGRKDYCFEINTQSKLYLNGEEAQDLAIEIACNAVQVLYPLQILVNNSGKWIDIYNFTAIQERWKKKRQELPQQYEGNIIAEYITIVDQLLQSENVFIEQISSHWFIRALFNGIHMDYTESATIEKNVYFPVTTKIGEAKFLVQQKIEAKVDENNRRIVVQEGSLDDERSQVDFQKKLEFPIDALANKDVIKAIGSYSAQYFLNPNNYNIEKLLLECHVAIDPPQKMKMEAEPIENQPIHTIRTSQISLLQ